MVDRDPKRTDLMVLKIPVNELAEEMGNTRGSNMILLGAYLEKTSVVKVEDALQHFEVIYRGKKEKAIQRNREAFLAGVEWAKKNW